MRKMREHSAHTPLVLERVGRVSKPDTEYRGSEQMLPPVAPGCPLQPLSNPEHHCCPRRHRPTERSPAPTRSCLILRAGRPQLSFQSRVRSQAVSQHIRAQDRLGTDCLLGPPGTSPFPPAQGLCRVFRRRLGLPGKVIHTHRGPQISRDHCLGAWVPAGCVGTSLEQMQGPSWEAQPGAAEIVMTKTTGPSARAAPQPTQL